MGDFALNPFVDLAANVPEGSFFIPTSLADLVSSLF